MALKELQFTLLNSPIVGLAQNQELVFDPPYQRASVWTTEQRQNLVKSLMQGLPVGAVFLNERLISRKPFRVGLFVMDGKQRLETIQRFTQNDFGVPFRWFREGFVSDLERRYLDLVFWDELSTVGQALVNNHWLVAQYRTDLRTEAAEAELYHRINYGGTPHTGKD